MLAVGVIRFGGPDVLELVRLPEPQPHDGQVRVRVIAATVNPADLSLRDGTLASMLGDSPPPYVGGLEFSGTVDAVGAGAGQWMGRRVAGLTSYVHGGQGAHAEQLVVSERSIVELAPTIDPVRAATVPMNGLTARLAIDRLGLSAGSWLAVTGAAGALGAYVCQLAAAQGVRVLAIARPDDASFLRTLGVEACVAWGPHAVGSVRALAADGVDGLVDAAVLGRPALAAIRDEGRYIAVRPIDFSSERAIVIDRISAHSYGQEQNKLRELIAMATGGQLITRVAATFPPADASIAHRLLAQGGLRGRPVLRFDGGQDSASV